MKRQIKAEIIAGSLNEHGQKITTWVLTYPRMIHAEMMTHRVFSRNAASSRAIPFAKMCKNVLEDMFIPVAFQKKHKGMQGTDYITGWKAELASNGWRWGGSLAVRATRVLDRIGVTKQLTNRLLEPFQWYTAIFTTTETENFFNLRCPQYEHQCYIRDTDKPHDESFIFYSRKDWLDWEENHKTDVCYNVIGGIPETDLDWLKRNKGQGEIHISLLAEAMWDSMNEYNYKQLKAGEWHIPFGDRINRFRLSKDLDRIGSDLDLNDASIKITTARCARVSYNNFEGKDDYEADIKLYDRLLKEGHMSPFEHCARAMSDKEYHSNISGKVYSRKVKECWYHDDEYIDDRGHLGWSGNLRGFVQLRQRL